MFFYLQVIKNCLLLINNYLPDEIPSEWLNNPIRATCWIRCIMCQGTVYIVQKRMFVKCERLHIISNFGDKVMCVMMK